MCKECMRTAARVSWQLALQQSLALPGCSPVTCRKTPAASSCSTLVGLGLGQTAGRSWEVAGGLSANGIG